MWRYLVGLVAGVLLATGGMLAWRAAAPARLGLADGGVRAAVPGEAEAMPSPPAASEATREQKRFSRYDHDRDGVVSREEYLAARRKAFAKLDTNGDGRLSFDEWAIKAETRFAGADADHSGALSPAEFATTRVQRNSRPRAACPPSPRRDDDEG